MKNISFILAIIATTIFVVQFVMTAMVVAPKARDGRPIAFSFSLWPAIVSALLWAVWWVI